MPIERAEINRANLLARRAGERKPRDAGRDGGADSRVEPEFTPASLPGIPDADDLLGFSECLALGPGAFGRFRRTRGGAFSFLRSAVRSHGPRLGQPQHPSRNSAHPHIRTFGSKLGPKPRKLPKCSGGPVDKYLIQLAGVEGLEPPTPGFGDRCSDQLSYTPRSRDRGVYIDQSASGPYAGYPLEK